MPTYQYKCEECGEDFLYSRSILSDKEVDCECGAKCSNIIITGGAAIIDKTPRTVGTLAEQNTKKFGKEYCSQKEKEMRARTKKAKQQLNKEVVMADGRIGVREDKPAEPYTPQWRKGPVDKSLTNLTPDQTKRYVIDGTKPN